MLQDDRAVRSREKILNWISTFEHERKHHGIRMPRVKGTGEWLLNSNELQRWRDDLHAPNVLWCHGIQGSGKSVLTCVPFEHKCFRGGLTKYRSLVIDRLRDDFAGQNVAIAFVYFDYRDQDYQSPEYMFASLLKQVALMKPAIPKFIVGIYGKLRDQRKQPQLQDLEKTLLLTCQEFDLVFIAIDALDECDESRYRRTFIQTLTGLQQEPKIRLLITSRFYPQDIRGAFGWAPQITVEANDSDLMRYLSYELENGRAADIIDESFKLEIIDRIASGAQKM